MDNKHRKTLEAIFEKPERANISELFGLAIETFVRNHQNKMLLQEINKAYSDEPDVSDKVRLSKMRKQHRKVVTDKW